MAGGPCILGVSSDLVRYEGNHRRRLGPILNEVPLVDGQTNIQAKEKLLLRQENGDLAHNGLVEPPGCHKGIKSLMEGLLYFFMIGVLI
jgi:hypothetical protein